MASANIAGRDGGKHRGALRPSVVLVRYFDLFGVETGWLDRCGRHRIRFETQQVTKDDQQRVQQPQHHVSSGESVHAHDRIDRKLGPVCGARCAGVQHARQVYRL